ncbi:MAG TPA: DUF4270 family protein [Puia sp.]|jgi:hypothetical protein|nr:DUF4270 family protein [Puia sp.]
MTINKYQKKEKFLLLSPVLLLLFLATSCQKQPILNFGSNYNGDNGSADIVVVDTATVLMSTVRVDSTATAGTGYLQIGQYKDDYFGNIRSRAFLQVASPSLPKITAFDGYDSLYLIMLFRKGNPFYGDTTSEMTINVNQVNELYQLSDARQQRAFYSNWSFGTDPTSLGTAKVKMYPTIPYSTQGFGDTVKVKLDSALGAQLFNMIYNNADTITKSANWLNWFHGLCISADPASGTKGAIYGFSDSAIMRIYYHEVGTTTSIKTIDFGMTNKSFQFNNITVDRSTSPLAALKAPNPSLPSQTPPATLSTDLGGAGYLQSATGLNVKLTFPYLNGIAHRSDYLSVVRAVLTVRPIGNSFTTTWTLPPQVSIDYTDLNNLIGAPIPSSTTGSSQTGSMTVNYAAPQNTAYTYDVTTFVKSQILDVSVGAADRGLMLSVPSPNNVNSFARTVLADGNAPTTQKVTLSVYYLSLYPHN